MWELSRTWTKLFFSDSDLDTHPSPHSHCSNFVLFCETLVPWHGLDSQRYRYFDPKLLPDLFWTWLYKLFFCLKPQMWKLSWTGFKLSFSDSESDLETWEQTQTWLVLPVLWLRLWLWVQLTELNSVSSARTWLKVFSNDLDLILKKICRINFENNWELRRHDGSKNLTETLN